MYAEEKWVMPVYTCEECNQKRNSELHGCEFNPLDRAGFGFVCESCYFALKAEKEDRKRMHAEDILDEEKDDD